MEAEKRRDKILQQLERLQSPIDRLRRQLDFFKRESCVDALAAQRLQDSAERFERQMSCFSQLVLYGYGKPAPDLETQAKWPNRPEQLE